MNNKINPIYLLITMLNLLVGLNPQIKNELPISTYINPEEYIPTDSLLKFEEIGYEIEDSVEKSKYYFIVAHLLNQKFVSTGKKFRYYVLGALPLLDINNK